MNISIRKSVLESARSVGVLLIRRQDGVKLTLAVLSTREFSTDQYLLAQ
jgi:hypothetical protein